MQYPYAHVMQYDAIRLILLCAHYTNVLSDLKKIRIFNLKNKLELPNNFKYEITMIYL